MMEPRPPDPLQLSSAQVLIRFGLRAVVLTAFASFGSQGLARTLMSLLVLSALFCAIVATLRRELLLGPVLTHWDEAAAYAGFAGLVSAVGQFPAV